MQWVALQKRNHKIRNLNQNAWLPIARKGNTISTLWYYSLYKHLWKASLEQRAVSASLCVTLRNMRPTENGLPTTSQLISFHYMPFSLLAFFPTSTPIPEPFLSFWLTKAETKSINLSYTAFNYQRIPSSRGRSIGSIDSNHAPIGGLDPMNSTNSINHQGLS